MAVQLVAAEAGPSHSEEEARQIFEAIDVDGRGFLDMEGIKHVFSRMGEELTDDEAEEMLREAGAEHDGKITFEVFKEMMGA